MQPLPMSSHKIRDEESHASAKIYDEAIIAYRCWWVDYGHGEFMVTPQLRSISYQVRWPMGKELRATCATRTEHNPFRILEYGKHPCPDKDHKCGIYSVKTLEGAMEWASGKGTQIRVYGKVSIWGRVLFFEEGFLSQCAYPYEIYVPKEPRVSGRTYDGKRIAKDLTHYYQVETEVIE